MKLPVRWCRLALRLLLSLLLWATLAAPAPARAEVFAVKEHGYSLDLPEGWTPVSAADPAKLSFGDPTGTAFLQVSVFPREPAMTADQMEGELHRKLGAEGDGGSFSFSGRDAYLSDVAFTNEGRPFKGFILVVKDLGGPGAPVDGVLIAFAAAEEFTASRDGLLSALDSFSPGGTAALEPGPISQMSAPFPGRSADTVSVDFRGQSIPVELGRRARESSQALVEREARLLASYKSGQIAAWNRFYRVIYRDSYHRLDGLAEKLQSALSSQGVGPQDAPQALLSWIQGFTYRRTGTLSDFLSPISSLVTAAGDCDSRAMLYDLLLDHLGLDSILLVSTRFSHALAGVRLDRPGASFLFEGRKYLVAEMTEKVGIGMIAKDMADPAAWIPMKLRE